MRSIKTVLILLFFLSITFHTYAQLGALIKGIDEIDLIAGPSLVDMRDDWFSENGREQIKIGYAMGIGIRYNVNSKISLGGKILFERKGLKNESDFIYVDEDNIQRDGIVQFTKNFDYITAPILLRYSIKKRESIFYAEGGPFIAYLLKEQTIAKDLTRNRTQVTLGTEYYERFDAGISLGLGYRTALNKKYKVSFQLNNHLGLTDISKSESAAAYTNSLCFLVGLTFIK